MKVLSAPQLKEWDQFTISRRNISSFELMEQAAIACSHWLMEKFSHRPFFIFCGPGNNGGDGLAIARLLQQNSYLTNIYILATKKYSYDFEENLKRLKQLPLAVSTIQTESDFPEINPDVVVVDALFGTGLNKSPEGIIRNLVDYINGAEATVISVDIPSGMFCDVSSVGNSIIKANYTLSFGNWKLCFLIVENMPYCGEINLLDIGLSPEYLDDVETNFFTVHQLDINHLFKPRKAWVHKYNLGHALFFAGSKQMMGAALLACKACMRAGAGLATLYNPMQETTALNVFVPEVISSDENDFETLSNKKNVICFGPGLLIDEKNKELLQTILKKSTIPVLIDAAGISILKEIDELHKKYSFPIVITPHAGEFDRLFGSTANEFDRLELAIVKANEFSIHIVLKGPHTIIVCPGGEVYFNTTGNSGMATAGAGDVLSGIITALIGQGYEVKHACILGVYLHGMAGDIAAQKISKESLIASDIIDQLGESFLIINKWSSSIE
jgi:hydroxyethylthiazole kinase-like uncharacterized protein yjeF